MLCANVAICKLTAWGVHRYFMVNSRLKILNGICMDFMEYLNEDVKKKGHFLYIRGRAVLIATYAKLLDTNTKYEFCGFNDGLRDTIN